jgi:hypothetical protein
VTVQFLIESLLMTLTGGGAGIVLGAGLSFVITAYAGWATSVSATAVALAFVVSFAVGVGFGVIVKLGIREFGIWIAARIPNSEFEIPHCAVHVHRRFSTRHPSGGTVRRSD